MDNPPEMLPCELADSDKSNILEAINLALFNLNNEEIDINLRATGCQLIILSAGSATYRVNKDIISPTKSRWERVIRNLIPDIYRRTTNGIKS